MFESRDTAPLVFVLDTEHRLFGPASVFFASSSCLNYGSLKTCKSTSGSLIPDIPGRFIDKSGIGACSVMCGLYIRTRRIRTCTTEAARSRELIQVDASRSVQISRAATLMSTGNAPSTYAGRRRAHAGFATQDATPCTCLLPRDCVTDSVI